MVETTVASPSIDLPSSAAAFRLLPDKSLAARVERGQTEAFSVLYQRYHQPLYRYCLAIVRDPEDAADALQTTMLNAFRALSRGGREVALRPWLFRIAHNEAISVVRRRRPQSELPDDLHSSERSDATAETREQTAILLEDVAHLHERQRSALLMRELQGLAYEEIAEVLDTSAASAKQIVFEARVALQEMERGRAFSCDAVAQLISARDGRSLRGRAVRSHLRRCSRCRDFKTAIGVRRAALAALPSLPLDRAASILASFVSQGGAGGGGLVAGFAGGAGGVVVAVKVTGVAVAVFALVAGAGGAARVPHGAPQLPPLGPRQAPAVSVVARPGPAVAAQRPQVLARSAGRKRSQLPAKAPRGGQADASTNPVAAWSPSGAVSQAQSQGGDLSPPAVAPGQQTVADRQSGSRESRSSGERVGGSEEIAATYQAGSTKSGETFSPSPERPQQDQAEATDPGAPAQQVPVPVAPAPVAPAPVAPAAEGGVTSPPGALAAPEAGASSSSSP